MKVGYNAPHILCLWPWLCTDRLLFVHHLTLFPVVLLYLLLAGFLYPTLHIMVFSHVFYCGRHTSRVYLNLSWVLFSFQDSPDQTSVFDCFVPWNMTYCTVESHFQVLDKYNTIKLEKEENETNKLWKQLLAKLLSTKGRWNWVPVYQIRPPYSVHRSFASEQKSRTWPCRDNTT